MFKWIGLGFLLLLVIVFGYRFSARDGTNALVAEEIRSNPSGERAQRTMLRTSRLVT
jgi:hypothetical protein